MVLVLVVAAALVAASWWWTHPRVFDDFNGSSIVHPRPLAQSAESMAVTFPATGDEETADLRLLGAEVHYAVDTAAAEATFSVCHLSPGEEPLGTGDLDENCRDHEPLRDGADFRLARWLPRELGARGDYLVLTVTPTKPGRVRVDRVDVSYALGADHLWRRGTERLGMDVTITAR